MRNEASELKCAAELCQGQTPVNTTNKFFVKDQSLARTFVWLGIAVAKNAFWRKVTNIFWRKGGLLYASFCETVVVIYHPLVYVHGVACKDQPANYNAAVIASDPQPCFRPATLPRRDPQHCFTDPHHCFGLCETTPQPLALNGTKWNLFYLFRFYEQSETCV